MTEETLLLIGRLLMAALFAVASLPMLMREQGQQRVISSVGVPAVSLLQPLAGLCLLVGASMLALGVWARVAAALLMLFVIAVTPLFHRFWSVHEQPQRTQKMQAFLANIGIVGGLFAFVAVGPGPLALLPTS